MARPPWRKVWPLLLSGAAVATLLAARSAGPDTADLVSALLQVGLNAVVAVLAWRVGGRLQGRMRTGWRLAAAGSAVAVVAVVGIVGLVLAGGTAPSAEDLWWLLVAVNSLSFLGLLLLSPPEIRGAAATRFALDGLIVGTAILFILLAAVEQWQPGSDGGRTTDLAYPAIDAASLTVLLLVATRRNGRVPVWYGILAGAFLLVLLTDALYAAAPDLGTEVTDAGYYLQLGLVALAARMARPWPPASGQPESLAAQWAVYVPFGLSVGAALYDYIEHDGLVAPLFAMAVFAVALVVTRTLVLLRENAVLARKLRETDEFKTQLLRFISHEVANPLSPLRLQAHLLRDNLAKDPPRAWQAVDRSIDRLESLSRDVRMMALAETNRLVKKLAREDLAPRVLAAVAAHQAVAEQRGLSLVADVESATVALDGERMDQVVDNLLSNSLKFTPAGGTITVRLRQEPDGGALLEVRDTGAGLSEEQCLRLFTAFGRQHGDAKPGLGLGLYLCKAIVEAHGGRISATSDGPDKGSTFRVDLPAKPPALPEVELPPRPTIADPAAHG